MRNCKKGPGYLYIKGLCKKNCIKIQIFKCLLEDFKYYKSEVVVIPFEILNIF